MINIMSQSSLFLGGSKLKQYPYPSSNLSYLVGNTGIKNFTDEYLQMYLQALVQFKNITIHPDSSNIINLVAVHLADGVYVKKGNQTICHDSN